MAARITDVRDAAAAAIQVGWSVPLPASVLTPAAFEVEDADALTGRRVYVLRDGYADGGPVTRETDRTTYRLRVVVVTSYRPNRGVPADDWVDTQLAWVESEVWDKLTDPRSPLALTSPAATAYPDTAEVLELFDPDALREGLFLSEIAVGFRVEE